MECHMCENRGTRNAEKERTKKEKKNNDKGESERSIIKYIN